MQRHIFLGVARANQHRRRAQQQCHHRQTAIGNVVQSRARFFVNAARVRARRQQDGHHRNLRMLVNRAQQHRRAQTHRGVARVDIRARRDNLARKPRRQHFRRHFAVVVQRRAADIQRKAALRRPHRHGDKQLVLRVGMVVDNYRHHIQLFVFGVEHHRRQRR